ncbi:MAG: tetratricopeptide repeat protein, partial [Anaerolineae bacterium]|nr:tetratricopeptide repeat protein [Anaerolineae bacterium]
MLAGFLSPCIAPLRVYTHFYDRYNLPCRQYPPRLTLLHDGRPGYWLPPFCFPSAYPNKKSRPRCRRLSIYFGLPASFFAHFLRTRTRQAATLNNIGRIYSAIGDQARAESIYLQSVILHRERNNRHGAAMTLSNLAAVRLGRGDTAKALEAYQEALDTLKAIGDQTGVADLLNNLGAIYSDLGRYDQATDYYEQSLILKEALGNKQGASVTLNNIGIIQTNQLRYADAKVSFDKALRIKQEMGDVDGQSTTLSNLGTMYARQGMRNEAIEAYIKAITATESVLQTLRVEELKSSFAGQESDVYAQLVELLWMNGDFDLAFAYSERARARSFLDQLGNQPITAQQGSTSELIKQEQILRRQIRELQRALVAERARDTAQQNSQVIASTAEALEQTRNQHEQLLTQLKLANPEYAAQVSVSTVDLSQVQQNVIDEKTTLIEYFVLDNVGLAWVIDRDRAQVVQLNITRENLTGRVRYLNDSILARDFDGDAAAELYQSLFAPLKPYIRHTNLIVVPHSVLHYL